MIQQARSVKSYSFLRELEIARFILQNPFNQKILEIGRQNVLNKFKAPNRTQYTGIETLKKQAMIALSQESNLEIKTANVWARMAKLDGRIFRIMKEIEWELRGKNIVGILEFHAEDKEINSHHMQFVGTKAEEAELIIAKILVKYKFELSIKWAIGRDMQDSNMEKINKKDVTRNNYIENNEYNNFREQTEISFNKLKKRTKKLKQKITHLNFTMHINSFNKLKNKDFYIRLKKEQEKRNMQKEKTLQKKMKAIEMLDDLRNIKEKIINDIELNKKIKEIKRMDIYEIINIFKKKKK